MNPVSNWALGLTGTQFHSFPKCFLYAWMRGDVCLYLGQSRNGITRLFNHHIINMIEPVLSEDQIMFVAVKENELDEQEKSWIKFLEPTYNRTHNPSAPKRVYKPKLSEERRLELEGVLADYGTDPNISFEQFRHAKQIIENGCELLLGKYHPYECRCHTCVRDEASGRAAAHKGVKS